MQTEKNIWLRVLSMILTLALLISCIPNLVYALAGDALAEWLDATDTAILQPNATPDPVLGTAHIVAEDESRRGETYKEYIMNNGLRLATVYPSAIHYEDNGQWKDIDNTLVAAVPGGKAVYQNAAGAWNVRFPQNLSGSDMVGVTKDGHTVQFGMAGELRSTGDVAVTSVGQIGAAADTLAVSNAQNSVAQIQQIDLTAARAAAEHPETVLDKLNSRLSYANVYPNTNVVYDLQGNQLKESIVLQQYDADLWGYRYTLDTGDLVPVLREDQQIDLCHPETNEVVLTMPAPYMLDNNGETSYDVEVSLNRNGSKYLLSYYLPRAWLAEADRAWPILLDPEISFPGNYSNVDDITVCENYNEDVGRGVIQCGYYGPAGAMRFYMQFLQLPVIAATDVIYDATISLYKPYDSGTTANISVYKVTEAWSQSTISWADQPIFDTTDENYVVCKLAGTYIWNITDIVSSWYETGNYGMVFKVQNAVESGTTDNWKQFYSSEFNNDTATMPMLTLTYGPCSSGGGDSFSDAMALSVGSPVDVNIGMGGDKRYFKFTPSTTGFYTIESLNNEGNPCAWLYNYVYAQLDYDDSSGTNYNFNLPYHFVAGRTYYYAVGCMGQSTGEFQVLVSETDSWNSLYTTFITEDNSYSFTSTKADETEYYMFGPSETREFVFQSANSTGDPEIYIYDAYMDLVGYNKNNGTSRDFYLKKTFTRGQTYIVVVRHASANVGSFHFSFLKPAVIDNGFYHLKNVYSEKYLDVHGPYEQIYVHQWITSTGEQQKWLVQKQTDGYYTIRSQFDKHYYVGITNTNIGQNNIQLFDSICDKTRWNIYATSDGGFIFEPKTAPGKALYAPNNGTGTEMQLKWMSEITTSLKWKFHAYSYEGLTFSAFDVGDSVEDEVMYIEEYFTSKGYVDVGTYRNTEGLVNGQLILDVGRNSDVVYINGHGGDGAALWIQDGDGNVVEYLCADQSVDTGTNQNKTAFCQSPLSPMGAASYWNLRTKWLILAQCDQLNYYVGEDYSDNLYNLSNAELWARVMSGADHPMHGILGYYNAAPPGNKHIERLERFLEKANDMTILEAWKKGHEGLFLVNTNWAMLYYENNAGDTFSSFTDPDDPGSIMLVRRELGTVSQSAVNSVNEMQVLLGSSFPVFMDNLYTNKAAQTFAMLHDKILINEDAQLTIDETGTIRYDSMRSCLDANGFGMQISEEEAVAYAIQRLTELGLMPECDYRICVSRIQRYDLSATDSQRNKSETLEYTVCIYRTYNGVDVISDQEDGIIISFDGFGLTELQYKWRDIEIATVPMSSTDVISAEEACSIYKSMLNHDNQTEKEIQARILEEETVIRIAYLHVGNEVKTVWVCSSDHGYGNSIFVDAQTGEVINVV